MKHFIIPAACICLAISAALPASAQDIEVWTTTHDRQMLVEKVQKPISFSAGVRGNNATIVIDDKNEFQEMYGFGFAMTGGSAMHLMNMTPAARSAILRELFGDGDDDARINYIRLTLGASDMNAFVFSYDDIPEGKTDYDLKKFNLSQDLNDVIPVMKEVLAINPDIKILASPWSAPAWMKTQFDVRGGKLRKECYDVYSRYFVKYVQEMAKQGITIDAVTIQNEPLNSRNTPSMFWFPNDQLEFVKDYLGPQFEKNGIKTKIVIFDHNLDRPDFPLAILNDPEAAKYIDGSAFHHYAGDASAMSLVHTAHPEKNIYFTEQMTTERPGSDFINIAPSVKRLIIDFTRNWSSNVILWNLGNDPDNDPHTDNGGCSMCQGAITIDGDIITRNIAYYVVKHASKFVPDGSHRIFSTSQDDPSVAIYEDEQAPGTFRVTEYEHSGVLPNVAFKTPDGKIVLIVANTGAGNSNVRIQYNGKFANVQVPAGAVSTIVW